MHKVGLAYRTPKQDKQAQQIALGLTHIAAAVIGGAVASWVTLLVVAAGG